MCPGNWGTFYQINMEESLQTKYKTLIKYVLYILLVSMVIRFLYNLLIDYKFVGRLNEVEMFPIKDKPVLAFISIVVLAPIVEELIFRLPLTYSKLNLALSASTLSFVAAIQLDRMLPAIPLFIYLTAILTGCGSFIAIQHVLNRDESSKQALKAFWLKNNSIIIIISVLAFGFIHLMNYEGMTSRHLLISPLIIGPQLYSGFLLTKIRLASGILWSIQLHMAVNGLSFMVSTIVTPYTL